MDCSLVYTPPRMSAVGEKLGLTLSLTGHLNGPLRWLVHDFKRLLETEFIA